MTTVESLPELIRRRREQLGVSLREAAERSDGMISHSRLGEIEGGGLGAISDRLLEGIARGLDLHLSAVRAAAGVPPRVRPFVVPDRANRLNPRERRLVLELIDTLLAARETP